MTKKECIAKFLEIWGEDALLFNPSTGSVYTAYQWCRECLELGLPVSDLYNLEEYILEDEEY